MFFGSFDYGNLRIVGSSDLVIWGSFGFRDFGMLSVSGPRFCVDRVWVGWFCWVACGLAPSLEDSTPDLVGMPSREYLSGVNTLSS